MLACTCGCGDKQPEGLDATRLQGVWIEVRKPPPRQGQNPRVSYVPPPTRYLRLLTVRDDGSFTAALVQPQDRTPAAGMGTVEGTWTTELGSITFEVAENGFPEGLKQLAPQGADEIFPEQDESGTPVDHVTVYTLDGDVVIFRRVPE